MPAAYSLTRAGRDPRIDPKTVREQLDKAEGGVRMMWRDLRKV